MNQPVEKDISLALETIPELLPYIPELLHDLWALGSSPDQITDLLRPLQLSPETTEVFDLGCGKGAVSITLAQRLGLRVLGVDAFAPFIEEARQRTQDWGVSSLCRFIHDDLRNWLDKRNQCDVLIFTALGPVLGDLKQTIRLLRNPIRRGGYLIIEDGYLNPDSGHKPPGYESYTTHAETLALLTAWGDQIVREVIESPEETHKINFGYLDHIRRRAADMVHKYPEAAQMIQEYVDRQERETQALVDHIECATWLLRKQ